MSTREAGPRSSEAAELVAAATAGDEAAFSTLTERHRRELQVHCYRMLGSLDESEDLVQEAFLRAWRSRRSFEGRSSFRAWLYKIATNACLDALERRPRRVLPSELGPPAARDAPLADRVDLPWLQPYPEHLLEGVADAGEEPGEAVVARETIELAFLVAIQHLPPRQRAVLILRDVLDWSAKSTAELLDSSVASVNSALQRARATLRERLPERRLEWSAATEPSSDERQLLDRYIEVWERGDGEAFAAMLHEHVVTEMPPIPSWYRGRDQLAKIAEEGFRPEFGSWRGIAVSANTLPGAAFYVRKPGQPDYTPIGIDLLRIEDGLVTGITSFPPELFPAFGLPPKLSGRA